MCTLDTFLALQYVTVLTLFISLPKLNINEFDKHLKI